MFAVIGDNNLGIDSDEFFNGLQVSTFPNPATDYLNVQPIRIPKYICKSLYF